MYKIFFRIFILIFLLILTLIIYLSYFGIKTARFNDLIIEKLNQTYPGINVKLSEVFLKLDITNKEIKISTKEPKLINNNDLLQLSEINLRLDFISLIKKEKSIRNLQILSKKNPLKDTLKFISTYRYKIPILLVQEKIKKGFITIKTNIKFNQSSGKISNYEIKGFVEKMNVIFSKDGTFKEFDFDFNIRKNEFNLKNIKGNYKNIGLKSNLISIKKESNFFNIEGSFENVKENLLLDDLIFLKKYDLQKYFQDKLAIKTKNKFSFSINKKLKVKKLNFSSKINYKELVVKYKNDNLKSFLPEYDEKTKLKDGEITFKISKNNYSVSGNTKYLYNNNYEDLKFSWNKDKNIDFDLLINLDKSILKINFLEFIKEENSEASLYLRGNLLKNNNINLKEIILKNNQNLFHIKNLKLNKDFKISKIEEVKLNYKNNKNFINLINFKRKDKKYFLTGDSFDFSNYLNDLLKDNKSSSIFDNLSNFSSQIDININQVYLDNNNFLKNLKGNVNFKNNKIKNANFFSSFQNNKKFSMSIKSHSNEIVTTLFSGNAVPFVSKFDFIKGFEGGEIDFTSTKINSESKSTIKIYEFKVKDLPVLTKILSLASLQGIADIMTGEGIRFSEFEMNFKNKDNLMTIDEIYSIGPAISVLMSGYIDKKIVSLRGTLVPATTINKTIGSIPLLGNILIGKKTGEGVFGVSFKIKGKPNQLKSSVNPIKTLTPRFITRTLEKIKKN
tara:strand:- start:1233 stop:3428 length:2196 start_codon:yes stop_codon:yes gene_type:complete